MFVEKQGVKQWWVHSIILLCIIGLAVQLFYQDNSNFNETLVLLGILIFNLLILVLLFKIELRTRVDSTGIQASIYPFPFYRKKYTWSQIEKVYVRKYSAVTEYGGWGVRQLGEAKAYNVSGNYGIQIVTKEKKKFLIGTQNPQEAEGVLKRYLEKKQAINSH